MNVRGGGQTSSPLSITGREQMNEKDVLEVRDLLNNPDDNDTTPYPIIDEQGTVNVVGDANKTEIKAGTYNMTFRVPVVNDEGGVVYQTITKKYENVFITPRLDPHIMEAFAVLKSLVYKEEDGQIVQMSEDESVAEFYNHGDYFIDAVSHLVATFLKVDSELEPYMSVDDVLAISKELMRTYPEMVKGGNAFFTGLPSR